MSAKFAGVELPRAFPRVSSDSLAMRAGLCGLRDRVDDHLCPDWVHCILLPGWGQACNLRFYKVDRSAESQIASLTPGATICQLAM